MCRALSITACVLAVTPKTLGADDPYATLARTAYQYRAGSIGVPRARADEPIRKTVSIDAALRHIEDGAIAWQRERGCISCHTDGAYLMTRPLLSSTLGTPNPLVREFLETKLEKAEQGKGLPPEQLVYLAAGLATDDAYTRKRLTEPTRRALRLMFACQNDDGAWKWPDCWPPLEGSIYDGTTVAAMAVGTAPGHLGQVSDPKIRKGIERLRTYLRTTKPEHTYHEIALLWAACRWSDLIEPDRKKQLIQSTLDAQRPDGGWSLRTLAKWESRRKRLDAELDRDNPPSDGHATGLAVMVLREAGLPADHRQIRRGIAWLKTNQRESGRWWTRSLNTDRFHWITYSGTCYALLALQVCGEVPTRSWIERTPTGR